MPASMLMVLAELFLQNSAMADATHSGDLKLGVFVFVAKCRILWHWDWVADSGFGP